jgi:hypothetical protein
MMTRCLAWSPGVALIAAAAVALLAPAPARAQDVCPNINKVSGFKIVLDDIHFQETTTPNDQTSLMHLMMSQLGSRLEDLPDPESSRYHLVQCPGRMPEGEASFPASTITDLITRGVLLEVWGDVFRPSGGKQLVAMNYVMIPLPRDSVSLVLQRQYERKVGGSPDEIVEWLASFDEISAYATVGRAVRLIASKGPAAYDSAKADLSRASTALKRAYGPHPLAAHRNLLEFVVAQECTLVQRARSDAAYKGPMRLLPQSEVDRTCQTGGVQ